MIELECPNCGRAGAVPREKSHIRLVCKKCHFVFHLDTNHRPKAGEPPITEGMSDAHRHAHVASHRVKVEEMPTLNLGELAHSKPLIAVFGVFLLGTFYYLFLAGGRERLDDVTTTMANALASNDLATVKRVAMKGSEAALSKAVDEIRNDLEALKKETTAEELLVSTVIIDEDRRQKSGSSSAFFAPKDGRQRDDTISKTAGTIPARKRAVEVNFPWKLDKSGRWRIDGHRLLQLVDAPHH